MTPSDQSNRTPTHVCMDCGALGYAGGYHDHGNGNAGDTIALAALPRAIRDLQKFEGECRALGEEVDHLRAAMKRAAGGLINTLDDPGVDLVFNDPCNDPNYGRESWNHYADSLASDEERGE